MKLDQVVLRDKIFQESSQSALVSRAIDRPTRLQIILWSVIILIAITSSLSNFFVTQVGSRFDEERYLILSRSLVSGSRYGMINSPGEPLPERYPFGYPLLISPIVRLFPDQLDAPKVLSLAATILNVTILFWGWPWFIQGRSYWWGLAVTGLYALAPVTIDFSRRIMAEPVFMSFSFLAILLAEKIVRTRADRWSIAGMSIALTFVVFTRTIGIVLVACIFFYLLFRMGRAAWNENFKILLQMGLLVGLIVAVTPVQLGDLLPIGYLKIDKNARPFAAILLEDETSFPGEAESTIESSSPQQSNSNWTRRLSTIRGLIQISSRHLLGDDLREITLPFGTGVLRQVLNRSIGTSSLFLSFYNNIISALVLFGLVRLLFRERFSLFVFYAVIYLGAIFLWNWAHPRLLLPIQPQIQLGWLIALETIILWVFNMIDRIRFPVRSTSIALAFLTILILLSSTISSFRVQDSRIYTGDLPTRSEWLKAHTQDSDIIMSESPEVDYLYSGRKTIPYPVSFSTVGELEDYLVENNIDFVLVASRLGWTERYSPHYSDRTKDLLPLFEKLSLEGRIQLVHISDVHLIRVYQVKQTSITTSRHR